MDPLGFALENFDAVGKYRTYDENFEPIDNTGVYADGTRIDGAAGLRQVLVDHSDQFLANVTQTLITYALGRGVEYYDAPAVRAILRERGAPEPPLLVDRARHRQEHAVSDEEIGVMIITKKALSRRTVLRGIGRVGGAALAGRHGAGALGARQHGRRSRCAATGSSTCRTGWR